jgi:cytidyltransferase-like protein
VCAYGAFDLLHPGHVRLLEQARNLGGIVTVAVQSDDLVRRAAAEARADGGLSAHSEVQRPITPAAERAEILAALSAVDFAAVIDEPVGEFLKRFRPDVFVRGEQARSQFGDANVAGNFDRALAAIGCRLVRLPLEPGYSTSLLIDRISGIRT